MSKTLVRYSFANLVYNIQPTSKGFPFTIIIKLSAWKPLPEPSDSFYFYWVMNAMYFSILEI